MADPKELKKLQKIWSDKLKQSGFKDIERPDGTLTSWDSYRFMVPGVKHTFSSKAEYYRRCEHFLTLHLFQSEFEKTVWKLHAEGFSQREIALVLNSYREKISLCIKDLQSKMKVLWKKENQDE